MSPSIHSPITPPTPTHLTQPHPNPPTHPAPPHPPSILNRLAVEFRLQGRHREEGRSFCGRKEIEGRGEETGLLLLFRGCSCSSSFLLLLLFFLLLFLVVVVVFLFFGGGGSSSKGGVGRGFRLRLFYFSLLGCQGVLGWVGGMGE